MTRAAADGGMTEAEEFAAMVRARHNESTLEETIWLPLHEPIIPPSTTELNHFVLLPQSFTNYSSNITPLANLGTGNEIFPFLNSLISRELS